MADQHQQQRHDIEVFADGLSASADALHERLMRAIRKPPPGSASNPPGTSGKAGAADTAALAGMSQSAAQALFETELSLRQQANSLYLDAAVLAASGLGGQQQQLLELTARAQDKIRKINRIKDLIDLTAELLALGAAVAAGKPEHILSPLEKFKHHVEAL
jgi:hypothetical protein